jgi:hypothetical protein
MTPARFLALAAFTFLLLFMIDAALIFHVCTAAILVPALADILGLN